MLAAGARPALALEMLHEGQQAETDAAVRAGVERAEMERRLGWRERGWPDFALYWPLFEAAARHGLPVMAVDLDPGLARRIGRGGLEGLAEAEREALASRLAEDPAREAAIAQTIRDGHCGFLPEARVPRMVAAWHARNVAMARRIAAALGRVDQVVVIVGRGHQSPGGLPDQLRALRPGTRQLVVDLVGVGADGRAEVHANPAARIVWLTAPAERPDPCAGLRERLEQGRRDGQAGARTRSEASAATLAGARPGSP